MITNLSNSLALADGVWTAAADGALLAEAAAQGTLLAEAAAQGTLLAEAAAQGTLLAEAAAQGTLLAEGASAFGSLGGMAPILLMFAVIYFIVLRPMSKQEKERKKRIETLKKGDQVVLQGGILGRISNADDPKIAVVELADRVKVRVLKSKIEDLQETLLKDEKAPDKKPEKAADKKSDKAAKADDTTAKSDQDEDRKGA